MGQVHHGSATTTAAIRRAIQHSQASLRALAKRCGVNQRPTLRLPLSPGLNGIRFEALAIVFSLF